MSVFTWGMAHKSAEDPEYIEEAIARMIQNHDDDPDAHLDPGQSLESHRFNDILDHKLGSVLADKLSNYEDLILINFGSLEQFEVTGNAFSMLVSTLYMQQEHPDYSTINVRSVVLSNTNWLDFKYDMLFQVVFIPLFQPGFLSSFGLGSYSLTNPMGFGFVADENGIRGYWHVSIGSFNLFTDYFDIDYEKIGLYRAQYFYAERKVRFFFIGDEVASLTAPNDTYLNEAYEPYVFFMLGDNANREQFAAWRSGVISRSFR